MNHNTTKNTQEVVLNSSSNSLCTYCLECESSFEQQVRLKGGNFLQECFCLSSSIRYATLLQTSFANKIANIHKSIEGNKCHICCLSILVENYYVCPYCHVCVHHHCIKWFQTTTRTDLKIPSCPSRNCSQEKFSIETKIPTINTHQLDSSQPRKSKLWIPCIDFDLPPSYLTISSSSDITSKQSHSKNDDILFLQNK
jgi:hypothetical protein